MIAFPAQHCYVGALVGLRRRAWGRVETVQRVAWCLAPTPAAAEVQMRADLGGAWAGYSITVSVEEMSPAALMRLLALSTAR